MSIESPIGMNNDITAIIFLILIGVISIAWGSYGIIHGNRLKKRADYMLSVGLVTGGVLIIVFLFMSMLLRLSGNWPMIK